MKKILLLSLFTFFLVSCGTSKSTSVISTANTSKKSSKSKPNNKLSNHTKSAFAELAIEEDTEMESVEDNLESIKLQIIDYAKTFEGTRYKFGGNTDAGMDCSGLVCVAFQKENISLPRISRDMATEGVLILVSQVEKGDLVFFKTSKKNVINHVGLVVEADDGDIRFIHSTTRAGVIISSIQEAYWKKAFVKARRVI